MSDFLFDQFVHRDGLHTLKETLIPDEISQALSENKLISYRGAEFEFPTCPAFSEGIRKTAENGLYAFTTPDEALMERICWWIQRIRGYSIDPSWIQMTHGTIYAVAEAIRLFVPPDGCILVLPPHYTRYDQAAVRQGRRVTHVPLDADTYNIDFDALEQAMDQPESSLLVITNPHNPTGRIWTEENLSHLAWMSEKYQIPVLSDEIFADVVMPGRQEVMPYILAAGEHALALSVISWGKTFSLTGINHACVMIRNPALREQFHHQILADHYGSVDPLLYAGLMQALQEDGADFVFALRRQIWKNAQLFQEGLSRVMPGVSIRLPEGSFVLWTDYHACGYDDQTLSDRLRSFLLDGDEGSEYAASNQYRRYNLAVPAHAIEQSLKYAYMHI